MQAPDLNQPSELDGSLNGNEKLRIQPNPFNESTTVYYTLDRGGRTQLLANSADGRELRVLQDANVEVGSYQFEWNTASLASGMYYVTLLRTHLRSFPWNVTACASCLLMASIGKPTRRGLAVACLPWAIWSNAMASAGCFPATPVLMTLLNYRAQAKSMWLLLTSG